MIGLSGLQRMGFWAVVYTALSFGANPAAADPALEALRQGEMRKLVVHEAPVAVSEAGYTDPAGGRHSLLDLKGQVAVVNFWATWCAPCREEMPELSALASMREHIEVIGLAYEDIEEDALRGFLDQYPVTYPIAIIDVYDPPADFDTPRGLPMTYLIAPDGSVARQFLGPISAHDIEVAIAEAGGPAVGGETPEPVG